MTESFNLMALDIRIGYSITLWLGNDWAQHRYAVGCP